MFHNKKVSVITVAYNCANVLTSALKSFAYQDYQNMEWIIVNDASTDKTAHMLQSYRQRDPRVKLCLNTKRKGFAQAYASAVTKATGDYITFLEPENFWVKDKISRQVGFMIRYNVILSHTSYAFADNEYTLLPTGCCHIEPKVSLINYAKTADINLSTFMMNWDEVKDAFPIPQQQEEEPDILMYMMQKGFISQGMTDVLTLCRPKFDYPTRMKNIETVRQIYQKMNKDKRPVPNLFRYQSYKASNIANIKLDPSSCIGRDVIVSLQELKNFKL